MRALLAQAAIVALLTGWVGYKLGTGQCERLRADIAEAVSAEIIEQRARYDKLQSEFERLRKRKPRVVTEEVIREVVRDADCSLPAGLRRVWNDEAGADPGIVPDAAAAADVDDGSTAAVAADAGRGPGND